MRVDGVQCTIELLETVFRVAEIFNDSCYSIYFLCVFFLLWLTSYYVILAFCVLCAVLWVGGVDVGPIQCGQSIVCLRLFRGHTCVCVLHAGCLNDNW